MPGNRVVGTPSLYVAGIVTAPAASATVASLPPPSAGLYDVEITASITGTPAAADSNNMRMAFNGVAQLAFMVVPSTGPTPPVALARLRLHLGLNGIHGISVTAIAAATAGAIYQAQIVATRVTGPG